MGNAVWPLADLQVVAPRLALRYISDDLGVELALLAAEGIHDPVTMPFSFPWTDTPSPELERNTLRYYWRSRAETTAEHWDLNLAVVIDGTAVGTCSAHAEAFPSRRTVSTGSWLGRRYQGQGIGTEMRQAALHLIFAGFDADLAITRAWHDNAASLGVTRSLPYTQTATTRETRRESPDTMVEFAMAPGQWATIRRDDIRLVGIEAVRAQLETTRPLSGSR
jgi:RimJ/RimL family protein N-acetyltransferase